MTWFKVDDQAPRHPKFLALGKDRLAGLGLWVDGGAYCNRHQTDGFIPEAFLTNREERRLAGRLVEVGLWEKVGGGYRMHDYHDYQPTKAEVAERRQKWRDAGRRGADKRWGADGQTDSRGHDLPHSPPHRVTQPAPDEESHAPVPVPLPDPPRRSSVSVSVPRDAVLLTDDPKRPDLVALRKRGMTYIRQRELEILDHIADNERKSERDVLSGYQVLASWIAEAPKGSHLVEFVMQRENDLKRERGASADEIEEAWEATKAQDKRGAPEQLGAIVRRVVPEAAHGVG